MFRDATGLIAVLAGALMINLLAGPRGALGFVTFETGQVRPLALTPDGSRLLAVNTPDARLEVFAVDGGELSHVASVQVGLEPVAVAARTHTEVWVVNHLSDSVSIVDIGATPPRVVRTLLVGDEPRDIVFAGPTADGHFRRAFITTARLGQNLPDTVPLELTTPATPRALVHVFDAAALGTAPGGTAETIVELFGDTPRALAASPDGSVVYAAVFQSGNQTATVTEGAVCNGGAAAGPCHIDDVQVPGGLPNGEAPGGLPAPNSNTAGTPGPETGLIVKYNRATSRWEDELGRNWTNGVRFDLPDLDVFRIDALADPPQQIDAIPHVGTVLYNMIVNPADGVLFVSNTEARNETRFEGPGTIASTVRGHLHEARITVIDGTNVQSRHLNKHIDALPQGYGTTPMPAGVRDASLSTPLDLAIASDGTLYVAAFGSNKVGVFHTTALADDSFTPDAGSHIAVSGGGPSGLALDEASQRLYVLTRFDNAVKVIDTATGDEIAQHALHNPEPESVVAGRPFLYDARLTSSNGEASCATCHIFADLDSLAWELGNPDDEVKPNFNPLGPTGNAPPFHPLKGPMTTQTLRGMVAQGPMHWRGDRTAADHLQDPRALDARLAFLEFNVAFDSLLGRDEGELAAAEIEAFADFVLQIQPPPNPVRRLDNVLTAEQAAGRELFLDRRADTDPAAHCAGCHTLMPALGQFGTLGQSTFADEPQEFKVPQLKNAYQKVGMFGTPHTHFAHILPEHAAHQGPQIRGFGFLHDGSFATVFDFLQGEFFRLENPQRVILEQFVLAFDTTFAPIVGQQLTLTSDNVTAAAPRLDLLIARARTRFPLLGQPNARECDLIAKATVDGQARGFLLQPESGLFISDRAVEPGVTDAQLRALAIAAEAMTYTCVPPGEGIRLGLDRDSDTVFDRDELDAGTDPSDPRDPFAQSPTPTFTLTLTPTITRTPTPQDTPTNTPRPSTTPRPSLTPTSTPVGEIPGDFDCNGVVDEADPSAACTALFATGAPPECDADCNGDGRLTAADVTCVVTLIGSGTAP